MKLNACKIAASTISMTSMYHNFKHQIDDEKIKQLPSMLSLSNLTSHNIDQKDFFYVLSSFSNDQWM